MRRVLKSRVDADSGENIDNGNENAEETTILMILGDCKHNPLSWRHITQTSIVVFRRSTFISKQIGGGRAGSSALLVETIDD